MGIKTDAEKVLKLLYDEYKKGNTFTPQSLLIKIGWKDVRLDRALKYLDDVEASDIVFTLGYINKLQNFIFRRMVTVKGINIIELNKGKIAY